MFKKALAHQSNATPLRSSARRQLLNALGAQYPGLIPEAEDDFDSSISIKDAGRLVLPEGVRSGAFETSGGVEGTFWSSPEGDVLWMTFGRNSKEYIPSLSLLAQQLPTPPPFPIIQLHSPLPPPLLTGAPLFIAAVKHLQIPHLLPDVPEGGIVAFVTAASTAASGAGAGKVSYVGVGKVVAAGGVRGAVERRTRNRIRDGGLDRDEGKFCDIMCIIGDHLREMGSKPPLLPFELLPPAKPLQPPPEEPITNPSSGAGPSTPRADTPQNQPLDLGVEKLSLEDTNANTTSSLSPAEISTLLTLALNQTLSTLSPSSLPIPASSLYSGYVLPLRPAYIPKEHRDEVVIAKSEWKKLAKWMKEVSKEGLIKIKETKGEVIIVGFDPSHPSIQNHAPYLTIQEEEVRAAKRAAKAAAAAEEESTSAGKGKGLVIEEFWRPAGGAVSFWEACGLSKSGSYPPQALKTTLDEYLAKHALINPKDHRHVLLDAELGRACGVKNPPPGERMARDEVMKRLKAGVTWSVSIDGVVKKGALQPISLAVKTRQGRKTVTLISNLETFSVDPADFAEELKKLCAGSATVQPLVGSSAKLGLMEVMVQGSQAKVVIEALVARGVPKRWIKEAEESKKR